MDKARFIRYNQERWNEMRRRLESGEALVPEIEKPVPTVKRKVLPAPPPVGPGLNVVLPYESGLSISGRKVIAFKTTSTIYAQQDSGKGRLNKTDFTLDQQLQVRVKGTVGRKVTVNVDFDDTREEKRDISVLYKGDPDEILQEAAFGDITISLPSTEFVSYSKSVFGVRAQLQFRPRTGFAKLFPSALWHRYTPKQIKLYLIGSRTKGITQTKRFTGQTELQRAGPNGEGINDISYLRRQFYQLAFATGPGTTPDLEHRPIQIGSERIFLDDQNPNNNNADESTRTFKIFPSTSQISSDGVTPTTATYIGPDGNPNTGVFKLLVPGVDYTVDYLKGVIRFIRAIQVRDVIVADYTPQGGPTQKPISQTIGGPDPLAPDSNAAAKGQPNILSDFEPLLLKPDESQFFATRELKNFYDLGGKKIVRDDGRGNFILKIIDTNRNEPSSIEGLDVSTQPQSKPVQKYPQNIDVDFENGFFSFVASDTFRSPNPRPFTDDIYRFRDAVPVSFNGINLNRYRIFSEFRIRKGAYNLDQINIVSQSEQVFVDGRKMTRDVDYFIDYDIGQVTFFRPELIRDDSIVEITFDFSPFGGQGEETLVGMRSEWYVTDNFFVGNSVLLNFAPRVRGVPDLRSASRSITVLEADVNWKNVKFGKFPIQMTNFAAEVARSIKDPNTANKATVETFEGIKLEDAAILNKDSWQVAANPEKGNPGSAPVGGAFLPGYATSAPGGRGLFLSNEDIKITDVIPTATVESTDRLQVLVADYKFQDQFEAASIVQVLNKSGLDFFTNKRQFMELWIFGDNSGNGLQFRLGGVNEFSDSAPAGIGLRTEDKDRNGVLSPGEDIGWAFINPDGSTTTVGANNGRLDTQDLNGNGHIDSDDLNGNYLEEAGSAANPLREPNGTVHNTIDWSGWKVFQVPLKIPTTAQSQWTSIKQVRATVINLNTDASKKTGTLRFGRISAVGTRLGEASVEPSTAPVLARVFAENNQDNPGYPSLVTNPDFQELFDLQSQTLRRREQALAIQFQRTGNLTENATVTTKEVFGRPLDFSEHETFNFFLFGDNSGATFLMRIGSPGNFLEYTTPISFAGWRLIKLDILDKNRDGLLDENADKGFGTWKRRVGSPSLRNITEITMGVIVPPGSPDPGINKIYVNEIHLTDSLKITGNAYRANVAFDWPTWGGWGGSWNFKDRNFQTLTSVGSGVDSKSGAAFLNLNRFKFLPFNTNFSYSETVTPQIQTVNDPNILVSVIDEGKAISTNQSLSGQFLMTQLPLIPRAVKNNLLNIDGSADHSLALRSQGDREDESLNWRLGTSYSPPWQPDILPTRFLTFKPLPTSISFSFSQTNSFQRLTKENTDTRSAGNNYSLRTAFQFFPQLNLTPAYTFSRTFEKRDLLNNDPARASATTAEVLKSLGNFEKTANQSVSFAGSLRILSWLTPSFSYSINTAETFNVNEVAFGTNTFKRGSLKAVNRNSTADTAASFAPKDLFQYVRYLRLVNPMINSLSFSGGYNIADADTYENIDAGFFVRDKLFIRGTPLNFPLVDQDGRPTNARRTNLTATDTSRISGRWSPFEGFTFLKSRLWAPVKNLNGSGTFTQTKTRRDTTGTLSFSFSKVWPDFILSTSELEKPLFLSRWMSDTRLNGNYQERLSEVPGQTRSTGRNLGSDFTFTLFKLLQFSLAYTDAVSQEENLQTNLVTSRTKSKGINGQVITTLKFGNWRVTPRYDQSQSESEDGTGKKTSDLVTRNGSVQVFGDINIPRFFRLPLGKQLSLTNRLILTSSLRYGIVRDGVNEPNSKDTIDFNLTGDFEITPNIRVAFGGSFTKSISKANKEKDNPDFSTLGLNSTITIQF